MASRARAPRRAQLGSALEEYGATGGGRLDGGRAGGICESMYG